MEKACALPFRRRDDRIELLAFRHPSAGMQFVKGTIEPGEAPELAARRELHEESGLDLTGPSLSLGIVVTGDPPSRWHLFAFETDGLPEAWEHFTADAGGLLFSFFWQRLDADLGRDWHRMFRAVLDRARETLPAASQ